MWGCLHPTLLYAEGHVLLAVPTLWGTDDPTVLQTPRVQAVGGINTAFPFPVLCRALRTGAAVPEELAQGKAGGVVQKSLTTLPLSPPAKKKMHRRAREKSASSKLVDKGDKTALSPQLSTA